MSKYIKKFDNYPNKNITDIGKKTLYANVDEIKKNEIFANIIGSPLKLFDIITADIKLTFTDNDNNSVIHVLVNASDRQISEDTKLRLLEFFINRGAPINSYNKLGFTPLHIAIGNSSIKVVEYLLKHGANSNAEVSRTKLLPLHLAIKSSVGVCTDLIIPQQLAPDEKKDVDELRNAISNKIISTFDSRFFELFCNIFDNYRDGYNEKRTKEEFEREMLDIINASNINLDTKKKQVTDKMQARIINIAKEVNRIDKSALFPNYMDYLNKDYQQMIDEFHDIEIEKIKQNEKQIYDLYDKNFNNLKTMMIDLNTHYNAYIEYFKLHLLYISKSKNNAGTDTIMYIFNNNIIQVYQAPIDAANTLTGPPIEIDINTNQPFVLGDPILDLSFYSVTFSGTLDNILKNIRTLQIDQSTKNKISKIVDDLQKLNKVRTFFNGINQESFNRNPVAPAVTPRNSYKFLLLNYIKICKLIDLIINNTNNISFEIKDGEGDSNLYDTFISLNINHVAGAGLPPLIMQILHINDPGTAAEKKQKFDTQRNLMNIQTKKIVKVELTSKKCSSNFDDMIQYFNDINESKYFLNFMFKNANNPLNILLQYSKQVQEIEYYRKYFNIKIDPSIEQKKHIQYYDGERTEPACDVVEIDKTVGGIIFSIDDICSPPLPDLLPNPRYAYQKRNSGIYKSLNILRNGERRFITEQFGPRPIPVVALPALPDLDNPSLTSLNLSVAESQNYIERTEIPFMMTTVGPQSIILLRNLIIRYVLCTTLDPSRITQPIVQPNVNRIEPLNTPITNDDEINNLLDEFDFTGLNKEKIYVESVKTITDELLTELFKYYKTNCAREILKTITPNQSIAQYFTSNDTHFNIDIRKLIVLDYRKDKTFFIDESIDESKKIKNKNYRYYKYNYITDDEANLCYKNKVEIVKNLFNQPGINYMLRDIEGNNLLHYLINIENKDLFEQIYGINKDVFDRMKKLTNNYGKTPIQLLQEKIKSNDINFYGEIYNNNPTDIANNNVNVDKLLFSNIFSSELKIKLQGNKELYSLIPNKVENIFNDLYIIFNLENVCTDIFRPITQRNKFRYKDLFRYSKTPGNIYIEKWSLRASKNIHKIKDELYTFLKKRHDVRNNYISNNEYVERYENTIVHVITLHFSNVFIQMVEKLLLKDNMLKIKINDPNPNKGDPNTLPIEPGPVDLSGPVPNFEVGDYAYCNFNGNDVIRFQVAAVGPECLSWNRGEAESRSGNTVLCKRDASGIEIDFNEMPLKDCRKIHRTVSKIGMNDNALTNFKKKVLNFDYSYKNLNLAQQIAVNLMDIKFNEKTVKSEAYASLQSILDINTKELIKELSLNEERLLEFNTQMTKIYDYLDKYFDSFNKKLRLFLTNYVKFIELQYNLQEIQRIIS
jgi:ankyrin repeat protein